MNALGAAAVILALVVAATVLGLWWRARNGRATAPKRARTVAPAEIGTEDVFGTTGTLVLFSTRFCAKCPGTKRLLGELTRDRSGIEVIEVDLTHRVDIADRFQVLQTPTILVLDPDGTIRSRINGAPDRGVVTTALTELSPPSGLPRLPRTPSVASTPPEAVHTPGAPDAPGRRNHVRTAD